MFIDKVQKEKDEKEAENDRLEEELTEPSIDFSEVAKGSTQIIEGNKVGNTKAEDDELF